MLGRSITVTETTNSAVLHVDSHASQAKIGLAGAGAAASFMSLNEWVALATLVFIVLQIGLLIPKYWALFMAWRRGKKIEVDVE